MPRAKAHQVLPLDQKTRASQGSGQTRGIDQGSGKMGQADLDRIEILGPSLKAHTKVYKLPKEWDQLITWQQPLKKV